jgi:polyhydroxybutyrate depolymerase
MRTLFFPLLVFACFSLSAQVSKTLLHEGLTRQYIECVPSCYNPQESVPLVIALHGLGDNMNNFSGVGFHYIAEAENFITLYPQAQNSMIGTLWNAGVSYMGMTLNAGVKDVDFINALIDTTSALYNIDPTKIYVCGFSMGGFMAQRYACECANRVAAIASVAGTRAKNYNCTPVNPVPVLHLHGTVDATIPMVNNPYGIDTDSLINWWTNFNQCDTIAVYTQFPDNAADSISVELFHYPATISNSETDFIKATGADHQWLMTPNNDINYTVEMWNFFARHSLTSSTISIPYNNSSPYLYPNPAGDFVQIMNLKNETELYAITDTNGKRITSGHNLKSSRRINVASLKPGIYLITLYYKDATKPPVTMKLEKQ